MIFVYFYNNLSDKWTGNAFKEQACQRQLQRNVTCRNFVMLASYLLFPLIASRAELAALARALRSHNRKAGLCNFFN